MRKAFFNFIDFYKKPMNSQSNNVLNKKINALKKELNSLSTQIEKEREESSEDDPSLQELLDKKEILLGELDNLETPDVDVTGDSSDGVGKTYKVKAGRHEKTLKIVIPTEADPTKGYISSQSPLAKALEGKKAGTQIEVKTPAGKTSYKILSVHK